MIDIAAFGLEPGQKIGDDRYVVLFSNPATPGGEVRMTSSGNAASFALDLDRLPASIDRIVFTATHDSRAVGESRPLMVNIDGGKASFDAAAALTNEKAVMLAEPRASKVTSPSASMTALSTRVLTVLRTSLRTSCAPRAAWPSLPVAAPMRALPTLMSYTGSYNFRPGRPGDIVNADGTSAPPTPEERERIRLDEELELVQHYLAIERRRLGDKLHLSIDVDAACQVLQASGIAPQVMVDVSHANSSKQHSKQIEVSHDVAAQVAAGDRRIMGLMIESHLNEGRQDLKEGQPLAHGVSITDACIGFAQTVPLLDALALAVQQRRGRA